MLSVLLTAQCGGRFDIDRCSLGSSCPGLIRPQYAPSHLAEISLSPTTTVVECKGKIAEAYLKSSQANVDSRLEVSFQRYYTEYRGLHATYDNATAGRIVNLGIQNSSIF